MSCCEHCGQDIPEECMRGPWLVQLNPLAAFYHGRRLRITYAECALLGLLIRRGTVSLLSAGMVAAGDAAGWRTLDTVLCTLRRKLRKAGYPSAKATRNAIVCCVRLAG